MSAAGDMQSSGALRWDAREPVERINFFDEQNRRRRSAWVFAGVCLLIAGMIGVVLSSAVTPLLLLAGGGIAHLLAGLGMAPDTMRAAAHGLGHWAEVKGQYFSAFIDSFDRVKRFSDLGASLRPLALLAPVVVPALVAAAVVWAVLRRISLRGDGGDLIARLNARPPDPHDAGERQLANIVEEMAISAGLQAPALLVIDSPHINAAAVGGSRRSANVLVTRGLLDRLDRDETSGVVAHLVASIGAGDIRLTHAILAVFQTFGFFVTFLDLPVRWSAWRALGGLSLVVLGIRRSPEAIERTLVPVEEGMGAETMPDIDKVWGIIPYPRLRKLLLVPLLPLLLVGMILRLVLFLWTALFLGPPLGLIWRNRRYAADAMAVQLTRNPDGLAPALGRIGGSAIPSGGEGREYCFIHSLSPATRSGFTGRRTITCSLHPMLARRVQRLAALGATQAPAWSMRWLRYDVIAQYPGRAALVIFLLSLLVPLGIVLVLAVL